MNTFLKVLRALLGALVMALAWAVFAWLASGRLEAAAVLAFLTLVLSPLILPDLMLVWVRLRGGLRPLELRQASPLRDLVLQCVLARGSLRPRFWVAELNDDQGFLWFERGWGAGRRQEIIVSQAWIESLPDAARFREFGALWSDIVAGGPVERRLRSFRFRLWFGAFWMLDLLFEVLHGLMRTLGLRDMPHPAFWCQRLAWMCKHFWFGTEMQGFLSDPFAKHALRVDDEPYYWKSWVFGVWSRYPTRCLHPSWKFLVESSALIES